jgi:tryptophan synthase alpha chain
MSKLTSTFTELREEKRTALMPYLTMGFPYPESALELVPALVEGGADLIELGVPFSDPLADGATIQAASQRALTGGMTPSRCLDQVAELRRRGVTVPLVLMSYFNPIYQIGTAAFAARAADVGLDGVIIPDLPPEEAAPFQDPLAARGIDEVFLLAPTPDKARMKTVAARSRGFLYLVSLKGTTGARAALPDHLEAFVSRVRAITELPLAVGFGISTPDQAAQVAQIADGVIVGSALIRAIAEVGNGSEEAARAFTASLRAGMDSAL